MDLIESERGTGKDIDVNITGIILAGGKSSRLGFNKIEIKIDNIPLFIDQIFKLSYFCNEILISTTENNYKFVKDELARLNHYYKYFYKQCNLKRIPDVAVFKDEESLANSDIDFVVDSKCKGPVLGIYNGLIHAQNFYSIILAFDMPFISFRLLNFLIGINNNQNKPVDAYILKTEKGFETLCSLYSKNCINPILRNIRNKNYKISDIFSSLNTKLILANGLTREFDDYELKNLSQDIDSLNNSKIDNLNFFNINTKDDYGNFLNIWNNNHNLSKDFYKRWKYFFYRQKF